MVLGTTELDQLAESWNSVVVPFAGHLRSSPYGTSKGEIFGSGFFVEYRDFFVLVTAAHVLETAKNYGYLALNINGKGILINNREFFFDENSDLSISFFSSEDLVKNGIEKIKTVPLFVDEKNKLDTKRYVGMGYPSTMNKLNSRYGKVKRTCLIFSVFQSPEGSKSETKITEPLLFSYDENDMMPGLNREVNSNPPDLHGVSGGPMFQAYVRVDRQESNESDGIFESVGLELVGVLVEHHREDKHIVATAKSKIIELILNCNIGGIYDA